MSNFAVKSTKCGKNHLSAYDATGLKKIYLAAGYTDLRRGIDGLATMI